MSKPHPGFFRRMLEVTPGNADEILYVGDRLDNDIRPAAGLGLRTALIRSVLPLKAARRTEENQVNQYGEACSLPAARTDSAGSMRPASSRASARAVATMV